MSPDLPEKVLGIDLDDPEEPESSDEEEERLERFVSVTVGEHRLALPVDAVKNTTGLPSEVTDVPHSSDAIEGVADLRGEITVVVDPRVHFPTDEAPATSQRLLVLDRPADDQPAALRVDAVHDVEAVPEDDVIDEEDTDPADVLELDVPNNVFDHPLICAIVVRKERGGVDVEDVLSTEDPSDRPLESPFESTDDDGDPAIGQPTIDRGEVFDEDFLGGDDELFGDGDTATDGDDREEPDVEVTATPLVDVERLLLASGHVSDTSSTA